MGQKVGTTLALMDTQIGGIEEALSRLRDGLLSAVGTGGADGLQEMAGGGPIAGVPSPAQAAALSAAVGQINDGLKTLRAFHAENGRRQSQVEQLGERAAERSLIL